MTEFHEGDDIPLLGKDSDPAMRQERIAEYVMRYGSAATKDLAAQFDVSVMTVHRDLDKLEKQGVLRKYRGGVTALPSSVFESNFRYRLATASAEKNAIARLALTKVEPGQAVMLDDSTTALALARLLPTVAPITVITNFHAAIKDLTKADSIHLIVLGGEYMSGHEAFVGANCIDAIASLRSDILFMSTSAVSGGIAFQQEQEIVMIKRAMMASATRRVLLVDHNKFGKTALNKVAPLTDFDLVVVDAGTPEDVLSQLREQRVSVEVAPMGIILYEG